MRYSSFSLLGLLCTAAIVSCSQDAVEPVTQKGPSVVLRANFADDSATRTSFGEFTTTNSFATIQWNAGDQLNVFYGDKSARYETKNGEVDKTAVFTLAEGETADGIGSASQLYGLYPYQERASASFASSTITASIPSSQTALPNTFDPHSFVAVGVAGSVDPKAPTTDMAFHNVCGGLCFTLQNPSRYSSIELSGNDEESVCGDIQISMSDPANPVATSVGTSQTKITLTPADGTSFQAGVRYYISLLPGNFSKGFTLRFTETSGSTFDRICSANVTFRRGAFAFVSDADDEKKLPAIRDGELLCTETEAANCYIVSAPGTYMFPLVRGINLDAVLQNVANVEVLWETANTDSAPAVGSIITDVAINKNCVYFKVPDPMKSGNALIAAKAANDKILWSWHIWACEGYNPEATAHLLQGKPSDKPMMDRNLGALSSSATNERSNGLFYQWGRKDPFPGAEERYVADTRGGHFFVTTGGSLKTKAAGVAIDVAYTIAHPTEYITSTGNWLTQEDHTLWNKTKNDYDPCPIGWKVPSCYFYTAAGGHNFDEEAWGNVLYKRYQDAARGYGAYFTLDNGGQSWYPNTGYISTAGQLLMVGQYSIYWSCDPMGSNVFGLEMSQNMRGEFTLNPSQGGKYRGEGHAVRCIKDN